jgi:hypothetical protein
MSMIGWKTTLRSSADTRRSIAVCEARRGPDAGIACGASDRRFERGTGRGGAYEVTVSGSLVHVALKRISNFRPLLTLCHLGFNGSETSPSFSRSAKARERSPACRVRGYKYATIFRVLRFVLGFVLGYVLGFVLRSPSRRASR